MTKRNSSVGIVEQRHPRIVVINFDNHFPHLIKDYFYIIWKNITLKKSGGGGVLYKRGVLLEMVMECNWFELLRSIQGHDDYDRERGKKKGWEKKKKGVLCGKLMSCGWRRSTPFYILKKINIKSRPFFFKLLFLISGWLIAFNTETKREKKN